MGEGDVSRLLIGIHAIEAAVRSPVTYIEVKQASKVPCAGRQLKLGMTWMMPRERMRLFCQFRFSFQPAAVSALVRRASHDVGV